MEHNFEQYFRESARLFETIPDVHPDDSLFKFVVGHSHFADQRDAVRRYFSNGRDSAVKLREILSSDLGIAPGTPLSLLEFASGYGRVTRHLPKILPNVSIVAADIHPEATSLFGRKSV
jgi:ubiquinone/menaquinone biosynthesis C-methylase UbiE